MTQYLDVLRQALILFPILAVLFTLPYALYNYHKYGSVFSLRIVLVYSFILYLLCVYCLVILPLPSGRAAEALRGHRTQLLPFMFLSDIVRESHFAPGQPATWFSLLNNSAFLITLFNLLMTLPFGFYLRYYFRCGWRRTLLFSFLLSLFFELTQLTGLYFIFPGSYRVFDVDDLLVNTAGSMLGFALTGPLLRLLPSRAQIDAHSFRRGEQVSFTRRLLSLLCDLLCSGLLFGGLYGVLRLFVDFTPPAWLSQAHPFLYFAVLPVFLRGRTFGKLLTSTRVAAHGGGPARWYQYPLRYGLLWLYLSLLPSLLNGLLSDWRSGGLLTPFAFVILEGVVAFFYLCYLFYAALRATLHRPLFYETLSRTEIVSTVRVRK